VVSLAPALAVMVGDKKKGKAKVSKEIMASLAPARAGTRLTDKIYLQPEQISSQSLGKDIQWLSK
jgi:hypothetical protein